MFNPRRAWIMLAWAILFSLWLTLAEGMRDYQIKELRCGTLSLPPANPAPMLTPRVLQTRNGAHVLPWI